MRFLTFSFGVFALLFATAPVVADDGDVPVDPVLMRILSEPSVLQQMHTVTSRHGGRLKGIQSRPFSNASSSSGPSTAFTRYRFRFDSADWEAGTPAGGGSPVTPDLGEFPVTVQVESETGNIVGIEVGTFSRDDD